MAGGDGRTWGSWGSSPRPAPEVSLVTWNTFSLLASVSTKKQEHNTVGAQGEPLRQEYIPADEESTHAPAPLRKSHLPKESCVTPCFSWKDS